MVASYKTNLHVGAREDALPVGNLALEPVAIHSACQSDQFALVQGEFNARLGLEVVFGTGLTLRWPFGWGTGSISTDNLEF